LAQFYNAVAAHLPSTKAHPEPSPLSAFLHAFSLITTRAFLIDLYHTVALVPFADLLNHSSEPHTSLASDDFVCHICGSLPRCTHDILDTEGGVMRLAHLPDSEVARLRSEADTVDMRADRAVEEGDEVFNSYGAMGDARLLVEWGFVAEDFAGEGLTWNPEDMGADEKVREMWIKILDRGRYLEAMLPVAQNGEAGHIESRVAEEDQDEDGLVGPPAGGRPRVLNLSQAGQSSINLWAFALLVGMGETCAELSPEDIETNIIDSVREVNDRWAALPQEDDGSDEATFRQSPISPIGLQTARIIRNLLQTRLEGMHLSNLAIDKLLDMRDVSRLGLPHLSVIHAPCPALTRCYLVTVTREPAAENGNGVERQRAESLAVRIRQVGRPAIDVGSSLSKVGINVTGKAATSGDNVAGKTRL
jgi:hypothetical protein